MVRTHPNTKYSHSAKELVDLVFSAQEFKHVDKDVLRLKTFEFCRLYGKTIFDGGWTFGARQDFYDPGYCLEWLAGQLRVWCVVCGSVFKVREGRHTLTSFQLRFFRKWDPLLFRTMPQFPPICYCCQESLWRSVNRQNKNGGWPFNQDEESMLCAKWLSDELSIINSDEWLEKRRKLMRAAAYNVRPDKQTNEDGHA